MPEFWGGEDLSFTPEEQEAIRRAGGPWPPAGPVPAARRGWRVWALFALATFLILGVAGVGRKPQAASQPVSAADMAITRRAVHLREREGALVFLREPRADGFHRVWDGAREGYVAAAYLAVTTGVELLPQAPGRVAALTSSARVREQPSLGSATRASVKPRGDVALLGTLNGWCLVWTGSRAGFVWGGLLEDNPALPFRPRQQGGERVVTYGERVLRP